MCEVGSAPLLVHVTGSPYFARWARRARAYSATCSPYFLRMPNAARFRVDPRLAALLGEGYRSSEHALKELIDNAWDADAGAVRVTVPGPVSGDPVIIADDGTGMTEAEVRQDYLAIARSRESRKGKRTLERHRLVKGRKGIGKFAGLMVADVMTVETRCRGVCTRLVIRKEDLLGASGASLVGAPLASSSGPTAPTEMADLEGIDLPIETSACSPNERGTTVTLTGLSQAFDPPSPDRFRPLLMLEYGRQSDFAITVNGESVGVEDIPGAPFKHEEELPGVGLVRLQFTVSEGRKPLRQSGIAVRAAGKTIGKPLTFGLDDDAEIPPKLLKKVYGELDADGLADSVTADWGDIVETRAYSLVRGWASDHLKNALLTVFANEMQLARGRLSQQIRRQLAALPEHAREFAERGLRKVLTTFWDENPERIDAIAGVALDAMLHGEYYAVVQAVDAARTADVATFAAALAEFGLADMAHMGEQARQRLAFLDGLDALIANPATREQEMHTALEHNLWVLGAQYAVLASNRTLRRVVEAISGRGYGGARGRERPDLLLLGSVSGSHVLIEFKRPSLDITRHHEAQATIYRDELIATLTGGIDILVIGRAWERGSDRTYVPPGLTVLSYAQVISRARAELDWLLRQLTADPPAADTAGSSPA
ncbi:ATP-binding protein [Gemmatimonas sp.]|uniref:ATP-binding protein n=1 Tax=Gemmatimonas sp. TaxID=1962908 RepID=UPI00286EA5FC|nr:ATP-binding protein [Gemmatimonas sp.]